MEVALKIKTVFLRTYLFLLLEEHTYFETLDLTLLMMPSNRIYDDYVIIQPQFHTKFMNIGLVIRLPRLLGSIPGIPLPIPGMPLPIPGTPLPIPPLTPVPAPP